MTVESDDTNATIESRLFPRPFGRRFVQLIIGLYLFGVSMTLLIEARLGLSPWNVFHEGVADTFGLRFGLVVIATGLSILVLWWPLRERPGIGTVANAVLIGVSIELTLPLLPTPETSWVRVAMLVGGVALNGLASGLYIGAGLGPGPRDGLMTGLARRGWSIRAVRTAIELTVLAVGWTLGGTVGVGTLIFAIGIGPLIQVFLPHVSINSSSRRSRTSSEQLRPTT